MTRDQLLTFISASPEGHSTTGIKSEVMLTYNGRLGRAARSPACFMPGSDTTTPVFGDAIELNLGGREFALSTKPSTVAVT